MSNNAAANGFKRVVITGVGAVSPAGIGADTLWEKVVAGESCLSLLPEGSVSAWA